MLATKLLVMGTMMAAVGQVREVKPEAEKMMAAVGQVREVKPEAENLSDLLPGGVAVFVETVGSDRRVGALTAEELEAVRDPAGHPAAFIDVLQPVSVMATLGRFTLVDAYGAPSTDLCVVAGPGVILDGDVQIELGEWLEPGDVLLQGAVFNAGLTTVMAMDADGNEIDIPPGGVLKAHCSSHCSTIGCDPDTQYACCWYDYDGCAHCQCVKIGKLPAPGIGCSSSGGTGCSMGTTARVEPGSDNPWAK